MYKYAYVYQYIISQYSITDLDIKSYQPYVDKKEYIVPE